jgi:hypothetical protein
VMIALTGGILFGAVLGVVIVFSRTQTQVPPKRRGSALIPRPSAPRAKASVVADPASAPVPAAPESPDRQTVSS